MYRVCLVALVLLFSSFLAAPAHAVIYDAVASVDALDEEGLFGNLGIRGGLKTGNTDERRLAGQTGLGFRQGGHTVYFTASGQYARTREATFVENSLQHLRYRFMFSDQWGTETFVQNERDRFRRIEVRALGGGGLRFELNFARGKFAAGTGLMGERMIITRDEEESENATNLRSSNYVSLDAQLSDNSRFRLSGYLQPKVTDIADTRLSARASLRTNITKRFFTEIFSGVHYDTTPARTVEPLDTSSGFSIGFNFRPDSAVAETEVPPERIDDEEEADEASEPGLEEHGEGEEGEEPSP